MTRDFLRLSNGRTSADVEFATSAESGFEPPNPIFLGVHAAFAKVLNLCGAAEYLESVERKAEDNATLHLNRERDFGLLLRYKLTALAH
jgi:hypothetical protein